MSCKNILLITSDQQHFNTIGLNNPEIDTPNLDRLAKQGTLFSRAYCPNPTCTPTRASIITGLYPSQHGGWTLGTKLPENIPTIGDYLNKEGFATALVGKAHFQPVKSTDEYSSIESMPLLQDLDYWKNFHGPFYGFDHVELARNHTNEFLVGQHYAIWMEEKGLSNWRDYYMTPTGTMPRDALHHWDIPEEFHYNNWIAERSCCLMEDYKKQDKPFFLWSSFFDPHPPYLVPSPWDTMYCERKLSLPDVVEGEHENSPAMHKLTQQPDADFSEYKRSGHYLHGVHSHNTPKNDSLKNMQTYYGMVSMMDKYIGKILDRLDELGLAEDTLVVFTTDHGHFFGQHGLHAKGPFLYEDLIKVPMIARCPGLVAEGVINDSLQSLVDFTPTFMDALGLKIPYHMTGVSQRESWGSNGIAARDSIICEHHHEHKTVQLRAYVDERYKMVVYLDKSQGELYDLQNDPKELDNLWYNDKYANLRAEVLHRYVCAELDRECKSMPRISNA